MAKISAKNNTGWFKFSASWLICFVIRLIPFRPPNVEPIMSAVMPISKKYGWAGSFFFAFASILLFDIVDGRVGIWTLVTALTYGLVGVTSCYFFKNKENRVVNYVKFTIIGTLVYDIITGLGMGPILFRQPFRQALLGQIPFTAMHLLGNIAFAIGLSPLLYRWIVADKKTVSASAKSEIILNNH